MNKIKENYKVNKGWSGDPCVPTEYSWTGVTCTSDSNNIPRITSLNLSSAGLTGAIVSTFGNLSIDRKIKLLRLNMDLSYNDLSGDLPTSLDQLSALTYLDVTGNNKISTTLPSGLQKRNQDGILTFRFGGAPPTSPSNNNNKKKSPVVIIAVAGVVVLLLIAAAIMTVVCLKRRKSKKLTTPKPNNNNRTIPQADNQVHNYANNPEPIAQVNNTGQNNANVSNPYEARERMWDFENRRFSYNDLIRITNKFQINIGTGGFGSVYVGALENGTQVAVKRRSHSSSQGVKEFLAEAQNLTRVHHKNLVSLIGYCMDGDCMALVYEYMQEGTLQDKLTNNARPPTWKQRIRIAYESALGLEYLHKACNPPLIHRDVKTSNILLNANLEAKIADFGLSRAFNNDVSSHVSTAIVGTPGYLDPEYYSSYQLSEKSDVFSFGVVLLEIITGQPPIIGGPEGGHVTNWVSQRLSRGEIESIIDPRMYGQYDINSVWKVTDLARKCTENSSANRPTMTLVVMELKESLDLEISTEGTRSGSTTNTYPHNYSRNDNFVSDVSQNSAFEMAYMGGPTPGPSAR
ncbi:Leucine-rich repeat protein kinase family protein [Rhynchospora pubera]|uniref:Leucine-rich repeat protein kinase family protein n=1 Tax=Rhynchospora pubera TaxID=906938 RepID=A0AAV8F264_9POAL|nr:Leucine-rich repeat protein kinase family protein [Rhynchospora pubera]